MTEDGRTVFDETAQAFSHLHEMEAQIEKLNKELETRTDYESDSYMALIEEVSSLSEKFYSIDATNYEEDVEKALLGLGFTRGDFQRQTSDFSGGWRMRIENGSRGLIQRRCRCRAASKCWRSWNYSKWTRRILLHYD